MGLKEKLDAIKIETEQLRLDESITASYQFYQEIISQLNVITDSLKQSKNEENLVAIVTTIEDLINKYSIKEELTEKPEFTYEIYTELRNKGKAHDEARKIGEENYTIKNIKGLRRWAAAYTKKYEKQDEHPKEILIQLSEKIIEKIKSGNYTTQDYIFDVEGRVIKEEDLRATYLSLGMGRKYRNLKVGVANKIRVIERDLKASGQNSMQYQNGGGRILEFGFDSAGKFYSKKIEDAVREHNLDGKILHI